MTGDMIQTQDRDWASGLGSRDGTRELRLDSRDVTGDTIQARDEDRVSGLGSRDGTREL